MTTDERIIAYHREGKRPSNIAERLYLPAQVIWDRMTELGIAPEIVPAGSRAASNIWELPEAKRRIAIHRRAAAGARKARRA